MSDEFTDAHGVWRLAGVLPNGAKKYILAEPVVVKEKKSKGKVKKNASTKKGN